MIFEKSSYRWISVILLIFSLQGCSAKQVKTSPVSFDNIEMRISFKSDQQPRIHFRWEMQFSPSESVEYFALPELGGARKLEKIYATLVTKSGEKTTLKVEQTVKYSRDLDDSVFKIHQSTVELPKIGLGDLITVDFDLVLAEAEAWTFLPLGKILKAKAIIESDDLSINTIVYGFVKESVQIKDGILTEVYRISAPIEPLSRPDSLASPGISVAKERSWSEVATPTAKFYLAELAKEINFDGVFPELRSLPSVSDKSPESVHLLADKLLRLMSSKINYKAVGRSALFEMNPRPIKNTLERRLGDCKDLAILFVKMLDSFDIPSEPVLVASIKNPILPRKIDVPRLYQFNHVLVYIPLLDIYVDPTGGPDSYLSSYSQHYANTYGLHLFTGKYQEINPGLPNGDTQIYTKLRKHENRWIGETRWVAAGVDRVAINSLKKSILVALDKNTSPRWLQGINIVAGTWNDIVDEKAGVTTASFRFTVAQSEGPEPELTAALLRPYVQSVLARHKQPDIGVLQACAERALFEERIEFLEKDLRVDIGPTHTTKISWKNDNFSQSIIRSGGKLTIRRVLDVNESHVVCSKETREARDNFFKNIVNIENKVDQLLLGNGQAAQLGR